MRTARADSGLSESVAADLAHRGAFEAVDEGDRLGDLVGRQLCAAVVEQLAFLAREDKKVDKRSGVSQRLPISVLENVVSNAERRALRAKEPCAVPRILDIHSALPSMTRPVFCFTWATGRFFRVRKVARSVPNRAIKCAKKCPAADPPASPSHRETKQRDTPFVLA